MATINLGAIKFNWKGAFNNSTAYAVDDVVASGGNSYVCIQASQGNAVGNATAYWNIMSTKGTNGTNGTDLSSLLSTRGDLVFKNASALARLAKGTAGQVLGQGTNDPAWVNGSGKTLTTQGDLLYRDGSGLQRLAKGTAGKALLMNSGANAPEWGDAGGGLIQTVSATSTSNNSTSSTSYVATNLTLNITPASSSNKILLIAHINFEPSSGAFLYDVFREVSGGSNAYVSGNHANGLGRQQDAGQQNNGAIAFKDTPNTTSQITYTVHMKGQGSTVYFNGGTSKVSLIAMEVAV